MVIIKNIFFVLVFFFQAELVFSSDKINPIELNKLHVNPNDDAYIHTFSGSPDNFILKETKLEKPKERILRKLKFISDEDKYAINVFGKEDNFLMTIGIGNPFYATYEHIGYEDRKYMGGPVTGATIEIAIPINIETSYFVISKRDLSGKFIDFQKISIQ